MNVFQKPKVVLNPKICFILIIIVFIIFSSSYSILTPAFEGPDEDAHYRYSIWLFNPELRPDQTYSLYTNVAQPLYYIVNSIFFNLLDPHDTQVGGLNVTYDYPVKDKNRFQHSVEEVFPYSDISATIHTMRLLSIFFGIITIVFVYKISKLVFPNDRWLPLYPTAFVSLIPMFLGINAVLNSDVLLWTLSTIALFFLFKFVNEPKKIKFVILTAVFTTLAVSTKATGLALYPIFLVIIGYLFISKQIQIRFLFKHLFFYGAFSVISISWLWVFRVLRNIDYANASLLEIFYAAFGFSSGSIISGLPGLVAPSTASAFSFSRITDFQFIHSRFIEFTAGGFWWNSIWLPKIYYEILDIFLIISLIGLILLFTKKRQVLSDLSIKKNHLLILSSSILIVLGYMYLNFLQIDIGLARYYFLIIGMIGVVLPLGWYVFVHNKKKAKFLLFLPLLFLVILNIQLLIIMEKEGHVDLLQDIDSDGIDNTLDLEPNKFSNLFNDNYFGGHTFGVVTRDVNLSNRDTYLLTIPTLSTIEDQVYVCIKYNPGISADQIANCFEGLGKNYDDINNALQKLEKEQKIYQTGTAYNVQIQKLEITPDLKHKAIRIKASINEIPSSIEIILCDKTIFNLTMGDEIVFSCSGNEPNILQHSVFLQDLPFGLKDEDLIQGESRDEVYLLQNKLKRHIVNPDVFASHGFTPDMIKRVPNDVIDKIPTGLTITQ